VSSDDHRPEEPPQSKGPPLLFVANDRATNDESSEKIKNIFSELWLMWKAIPHARPVKTAHRSCTPQVQLVLRDAEKRLLGQVTSAPLLQTSSVHAQAIAPKEKHNDDLVQMLGQESTERRSIAEAEDHACMLLRERFEYSIKRALLNAVRRDTEVEESRERRSLESSAVTGYIRCSFEKLLIEQQQVRGGIEAMERDRRVSCELLQCEGVARDKLHRVCNVDRAAQETYVLWSCGAYALEQSQRDLWLQLAACEANELSLCESADAERYRLTSLRLMNDVYCGESLARTALIHEWGEFQRAVSTEFFARALIFTEVLEQRNRVLLAKFAVELESKLYSTAAWSLQQCDAARVMIQSVSAEESIARNVLQRSVASAVTQAHVELCQCTKRCQIEAEESEYCAALLTTFSMGAAFCRDEEQRRQLAHPSAAIDDRAHVEGTFVERNSTLGDMDAQDNLETASKEEQRQNLMMEERKFRRQLAIQEQQEAQQLTQRFKDERPLHIIYRNASANGTPLSIQEANSAYQRERKAREAAAAAKRSEFDPNYFQEF
jgi:hypothetical protein